GELQMTSYGISGIPVFQISRFAAEVLERKKEVFLLIDSLPGFSEEEVYEELEAAYTETAETESEPPVSEPESVFEIVHTPRHAAPEPAFRPEPEPETEPEPEAEEAPAFEEEPPVEEPRKKKGRKKKKRDAEPDEDGRPAKETAAAKAAAKPQKDSVGKRLGLGMLSLIFAVISLVCLAWSVQNIHPETTTVEVSRGTATADLVSRLNNSVFNSKADALSDIAYIRKQYSIPEEALVAPAPNPACYGSVSIDNAEAVLEVIQKARDSGLLDGQDVIFDPNVSFYYDSTIQYYCDDTILVICWKELIDGFTCSCCEVKIADASQFRRKITDDTFGSPLRVFASELSNSVNAVVAMNADFYMFRDFGVMAYNRHLYRMDTSTYTGMYKKYNCVDTCFITGSGDFLFTHRQEEYTWEQMQQFIADNDVIFSISFGPVLVENGVIRECDWYPAGEINTGYSRAGIGQFAPLHYYYMSLNHSPERAARWTVNQFGREMYNKGVFNAYCLDGGQTSEIVFRGQPYNYIDFGAERGVSDIIYFATAIPESEVTS
ncbi:MAG: phosphodiester glycosidase family protein, partial [Oscillospiraceae bacterium]|nr:phosphodiester glycosidase family protein [Oscillospiraceae bacterium]